MLEPITKSRLHRYVDSCKTLNEYMERKKRLELKVGGLSGIDYSGIKVQVGNGRKTSEEERYTMALEKINKEITKLRSEIEPEHEIIVNQIRRLSTSKYRTIITLKYIEGRSTQDLVEYFFCDDPLWNPNNDIEDFKKTQEYENYRRQYTIWQQKAISEMELISSKPYVPIGNQLSLGV